MKQITKAESNPKYIRNGTGGVQSVHRALDLLEVFLEHGRKLVLSRIAELLRLEQSHRLPAPSYLEERGFVKRSPGSRKYTLGVRVFELGYYFQRQLGVRQAGSALLKANG
jgi:DNA-binding IclR family transcriptional regulator